MDATTATTTYLPSISTNVEPGCTGVHFLSVLLGFGLGIFFTLAAIGLGVGIAWIVNYNITRKLRGSSPVHYESSLVRQHHFPAEMDALAPGVISPRVSFSNRTPWLTPL